MADSDSTEERTVLLAYDDSDHSNYAFDWYVENLYRKGDRLIVVYCAEYKGLTAQPVLSTDPALIERIIQEEKSRSHSIAERAEAKMRSSGIHGKIMGIHGDPGEAVVKASKEVKAAMIVTGTRGLGTIRRTILGSVSDYVLHHSHIPVVVCKHPELHHHHHQQHKS